MFAAEIGFSRCDQATAGPALTDVLRNVYVGKAQL